MVVPKVNGESPLDLEEVQKSLASSSSVRRISELKALRERSVDDELPVDLKDAILETLFKTYSFYIDRRSRQAVQQCLAAFFREDAAQEPLSNFLDILQAESKRPGLAPTNAFVLGEWCSLFLQRCARSKNLWEQYGLDLLLSDATVLELCLGSNVRSSVKSSMLDFTRNALRRVFLNPDLRDTAIENSVAKLTAKSASGASAKHSILLGLIASECSRIPEARRILEKQSKSFYEFYVREVLGSRTVVPLHVANGLSEFFTNFTSGEDFQNELLPSLEKALLRAPEVMLGGVVSNLINALAKDIDLSGPLQASLLKPLLSNTKSITATIRSGSLSTFTAIIHRCHDETSLLKITHDVLEPLKTSKLSGPDQKSCHAFMLAELPYLPALSKDIPAGLAQVLTKEANENVINAGSIAMTRHISYGVANGSKIDKAVIDLYNKGLADKKPNIRRIWALRVGELLWQAPDNNTTNTELEFLAGSVIDKLQEIWSEVIANPIVSAQNGILPAAYMMTALSRSKLPAYSDQRIKQALMRIDVTHHVLAPGPKPSFLLNHRIYTKLGSEDGFTWFLRALTSVSEDVVRPHLDAGVAEGWSQALIYLMSSTSVDWKSRTDTGRALTRMYLQRPTEISSLILRALWSWWHHVTIGEKDSPAAFAKTGNHELYKILRSIFVSPEYAARLGTKVETAILEDQLANFLVLCRPEIIPRARWIELCQRTGIDPGTLAGNKRTSLLTRVANPVIDNLDQTSAAIVRHAACDAAAELAFVAPDPFTALLVKQFTQDLDPKQLQNVGPTEAAIYRTPDGTAFIDVLAKKDEKVAPNKNIKDYEILKWEEDLRAQLESKKGQQRKLTSDEKKRVDSQLVKEQGIRRELSLVDANLRRGIGLISSLARGPPSQAELWMSPAIKALINVLSNGGGLIAGEALVDAYLACAGKCSPRLGELRKFVGVSTLRAIGVSQLNDSLLQEPLGDLVTRVLYKLRFAGEQRPFDSISFTYILPLIFSILRDRGIGKISDEDIDEQVVLALEFVSFHADTCSDEALPRAEIISILISSMQDYTQHFKMIKDCLSDLCRCVSTNITDQEIKQLIKGVTSSQVSVRTSVLQAVSAEIDLTDYDFVEEIWLACHDDDAENIKLGREIWDENALEVEEQSAFEILPYLESKDSAIRRAAARSVAECTAIYPSSFTDILSTLEGLYKAKAKPLVPLLDEYGMQKKMDLKDPWETRSGIALAFKELCDSFNDSHLVDFIQFLIQKGPLGDRSPIVRDEMLDAATSILTHHGQGQVEQLMKICEATLEAPDKGSETQDWINEATIILYGALARHLKPGDSRIPKVVRRLLATLNTPSESVQYAVAQCLPPLVRASPQEASNYVQEVLEPLLQSKKYASRRGAAYGLAGIVNGRGILTLREFRIMTSLKGAIENKKDTNHRQGALLAYELLSLILGRVFEPYVIQILPQLLSSFGDSSAEVREACLDTAKTCFASLSSFGVKKILPTLLEGLDEQQWRSKKGACDLLGVMAYLDPQQLALSLPEIIPPLTNVLNDSHKEVRASANRSLQRFGEVISNPEIKGVVGVLLKALSDPTKYTEDSLDSLIKISFIHYLDAPSLALVVRILERGLGDRSGTKRKAAQIIASLAHLTERKDLVTHLPVLVAGLKLAIVDPVPTTRATSSKALGSLIEKLGEDALPDLIPSLMSTLKSDTGAGDRLGSAQALSEVLAGLGTMRLEETLPTILQNVSSAKPAVREGFMSLFIFLPACFGNSFANYLSKIIPPILAGLADDIESIRETSLRAGRLLVKNFATRAIDLLLPELERGLADDSYRIRLSSVELVGDLLFNLTGISGNTEQDEVEENAGEAGQSLLEVLGEEKRNKILSSLYICRCDTSGLVRSAAIAVWKALVATPRTLKELIPTLTQLLIRRLASPNMEHKVIAGNALGELIRKAGEGVLSSLLPTLEEGLQTSMDTDAKQGICIALRELISSASPEVLEDYEKTLISVVRTALVDPDENVREAAAEAFDSLQRLFGKKAVDQVLPYLLNLLRTEAEAENALAALLTLLTEPTRSNIILPNLIPTLIAPPISSFNAKALASLSEVAGSAMTRRLPGILNSLMDSIVACKDPELARDTNSSFDAVLLSVDEYDGLNTAMSVMLTLVKHDDHRRRATADRHLANFFVHATVDYSRYHQDLIRGLLVSFDDRDTDVVKAAWEALSELVKHLKKEEMESLVIPTRQVLQTVGVAGANLPGFGLPKGINAILPIFLQGLMNGTTEQRMQSALAISDIIDRSSGDSLRPFVTQITGPLIRVVSERSVDVKAAILLTLNNLLEKIPTFLKPFLPQLQRTFAKSLADASSEILRARAAKALGTLITMTPRIDPLIAGKSTYQAQIGNAQLTNENPELVTGCKTQDAGVRNAMLKALYEVVSKAGGNMNETSRASILGLIDTEISDTEDAMIITNARLLGALIKVIPTEASSALIRSRVLSSNITKASILALNAVLVESPKSLTNSSLVVDTPTIIAQGISSKNPYLSDNAILAAGKFLLTDSESDSVDQLLKSLASVLPTGNPTDSRRLALVVLRTLSRNHPSVLTPAYLPLLAPPIFASVRDPIIPIKLSAEAAFLAIFRVVEEESRIFDGYMADTGSGGGANLPPNIKRSMQDYFRRVGTRLGQQARERKEAEGGAGGLGLGADERDDEREVWSVGTVELGDGVFSSD
ncbi:MAG: translational activator of GCN4 [Chaenotheca gracillima]|nr:MAG: translational activator of GCN4 [Chaenotheca gracillima]